jgi:hypothetical protein
MNGICSAEFGRRYATRVCFCGCQTRAEARGYARLPLSRLELCALADAERSPVRLPLSRLELPAPADGERSPAIHRRVSVEKWIRRRVATVDPKGIASNSMNGISSAEFGRRYATRFCFCGHTRAEARGYAQFPLSRQGQTANWEDVKLEARGYARWPLSRLELSALADGERSPAIHRRVSVKNECSRRVATAELLAD